MGSFLLFSYVLNLISLVPEGFHTPGRPVITVSRSIGVSQLYGSVERTAVSDVDTFDLNRMAYLIFASTRVDSVLVVYTSARTEPFNGLVAHLAEALQRTCVHCSLSKNSEAWNAHISSSRLDRGIRQALEADG